MSAFQLHPKPQFESHPAQGAERREFDRWNVEGVATVFCIAGERFGEMYELHMLDCSNEGMGATCDHAIPPGTLVSIGFQKPGILARRGEVVNARPCGQGYRIAIRFDSLAAA